MSERGLAFVGDIHGMTSPLRAALSALGGSRHLVFLGDYVNRGPESQDVLQILLEAVQTWPGLITLLRGNHEEELLNFIASGDLPRFVRFGGLATIASYAKGDTDSVAEFKRTFPPAHLDLLISLADYYERDDVIASHSGINPGAPSSRERTDVVTGSHQELFSLDVVRLLGKSLVCGHYVQRSREAFAAQGFYAIDTGCGSLPGAPLTALLWPEKTTVMFGDDNASSC